MDDRDFDEWLASEEYAALLDLDAGDGVWERPAIGREVEKLDLDAYCDRVDAARRASS